MMVARHTPRAGVRQPSQHQTLRARSECEAGALFGLTRHGIEGSVQRGKRRWCHKHVNMVEARDEFNREIRFCGLQRRGMAIGIELVVTATYNQCHRLFGALERAKIIAAPKIHRQPKRIDAGQVLVAGRNSEDDSIETVEPVNAHLVEHDQGDDSGHVGRRPAAGSRLISRFKATSVRESSCSKPSSSEAATEHSGLD